MKEFCQNVKRLSLLILLICSGLTLLTSAVTSESKSAVSKASVLTPISLENTNGQGLKFGSITIGAVNSTIRVSATSSVSPNVTVGDAVVLSTITQEAAKFTVTGESGKSYAITLPSTMNVIKGSDHLVVNNFTCSNGSAGVIGTNDVFYIGADLVLPSSAVSGAYQGTFSLVVVYN